MTDSNHRLTITPDEAELRIAPQQIAPRCATVQDLIDAALKLPVGHTLIGDATVTPEDAKALLDTPAGTVTRHD